MLCWKPSVWPTSCATTYSISRPIRSSGNGSFCARGSSGPDLREVPGALQVHDVVVHLDVRFEDLAGARVVTCGPDAFSIVEGSQRITE